MAFLMSRKERINQLIHNDLKPDFLDVEDESHRHHVPEGAESHFKLSIVSISFQGLARIDRHRLINKLLAEELQSGLHALSLYLYTPEEWKSRGGRVPSSPACRDGYRHG